MKNEVNGLTCVVCEKPLIGGQTKYCSQKCRNTDYYQKNKEKILEYQRNYVKRNKEKYREYHRVYYQNNKEKIKERSRNYNKRHREERRAYNKAYRQWRNEYEKLYFDDPFKSATDCEYCLYFDTCRGEREVCEYK